MSVQCTPSFNSYFNLNVFHQEKKNYTFHTIISLCWSYLDTVYSVALFNSGYRLQCPHGYLLNMGFGSTSSARRVSNAVDSALVSVFNLMVNYNY